MNFLCLAAVVLCGMRFYAEGKIWVVKGYDPGSCNQQSHLKEVLVKDRNDDDKILICVRENNVYIWTSLDGLQNTVGEFFNPGYDCADILNKLQDAKDGFYWITLKSANPRKAWCDMTTDGGGFILIARKNNSITWSVPSNDIPVEPYGDPHWSSTFGDAPILDFRVQMATDEDFKSTVAHWSFRLQSTRPLKELLMTTDGCDRRSAGIGNIAYVKDLQTERIVTTTMRCSKFGFAHHSSSPFGWPKMNSCLAKPCPWGFAYLVAGKYKHHLDYYGAFSYSTTRRISGMEYNATAFVGCDDQACCACYGPLGGTKNYCAEKCKAINGGTVTKKVFTWFWVRSSLPKRLWKKCMEYEVKREDGKMIWYKLVGHSVVPVQGRCGNQTLLHDGIVVVPDSKAAKKVPAIDGLLEYRKDKQELYVRSNKMWNAVAQKQEIRQEALEVDSKLKDINQKLSKQNQRIRQEELEVDSKLKDINQKFSNQNQRMDLKFVEFEKKILKIFTMKECSSYTLLDNQNRNIKYRGGSLLCDNGISTRWYRFVGAAGTQLPTTCVDRKDTKNPICRAQVVAWLNGAHPSVSDGKVTRRVCFSWDGKCCQWNKNIEVINCGLFYIYKLVPAPVCNGRYCGTDV